MTKIQMKKISCDLMRKPAKRMTKAETEIKWKMMDLITIAATDVYLFYRSFRHRTLVKSHHP